MDSYYELKISKILQKLNNQCLYKNVTGFRAWTKTDIWDDGYRDYCHEVDCHYTLCDSCENILLKFKLNFVAELSQLREEIDEIKTKVNQFDEIKTKVNQFDEFLKLEQKINQIKEENLCQLSKLEKELFEINKNFLGLGKKITELRSFLGLLD